MMVFFDEGWKVMTGCDRGFETLPVTGTIQPVKYSFLTLVLLPTETHLREQHDRKSTSSTK